MRARTTRCSRVPALSLLNRFFRRHFTVSSPTPSASAICFLDKLWATSRRTSASLGVSRPAALRAAAGFDELSGSCGRPYLRRRAHCRPCACVVRFLASVSCTTMRARICPTRVTRFPDPPCVQSLFHWFASLALLTFGQDAAADREFRKLGVGRGLEANVVTAMLVDRDGLLWVASREGLFSYDGYLATAFSSSPDRPGSISDVDVRSLYESDDGVLWVSTNTGGLNRRDPVDGRVHPVPSRFRQSTFTQLRKRLRRRAGCQRQPVGGHPEWAQSARCEWTGVHPLLPRARQEREPCLQLGRPAAPRAVEAIVDRHDGRWHRSLG